MVTLKIKVSHSSRNPELPRKIVVIPKTPLLSCRFFAPDALLPVSVVEIAAWEEVSFSGDLVFEKSR